MSNTLEFFKLSQSYLQNELIMYSFQSKRPLDAEFVSNEALRSMCENVLQLLSTTVDNMDYVSCAISD